MLGHLQRGGSPTTFDRLISLRFGAAAVRFIAEGHRNVMVASQPPEMRPIPVSDVIGRTKTVPLDSDTVMTCRDLGISLRRLNSRGRTAPSRGCPGGRAPAPLAKPSAPAVLGPAGPQPPRGRSAGRGRHRRERLAEHRQRRGDVPGDGRLEAEPLPGARVVDREAPGVERLPAHRLGRPPDRVVRLEPRLAPPPAVGGVGEERVARLGEVDADLVGPAGLQRHLEQRRPVAEAPPAPSSR